MLEKIRGNFPVGSESVVFKMAMIGILSLVMLIPMGMIESLVTERHQRLADTRQEISRNWGQSQLIGGPVLTVPYRLDRSSTRQNSTANFNQSMKTVLGYAHFLPELVAFETRLEPEIRHRGLYKIPVYQAKLNVHGEFRQPDLAKLDLDHQALLWHKAFLSVTIADKKGLTEIPVLQWNEQSFSLGPASKPLPSLGPILQVELGDVDFPNRPLSTFSFELALRGSQSLEFLPFGKKTTATLTSAWQAPKFFGSALPVTHQIRESGFTAAWKVLELNRNYPQQWQQQQINRETLHSSAFGVELLLPVSAYLQTTRSVKYAVLYIVLTFTAFFMFETLGKLRIHPFQYLLIGLSICLFYLNLLSISEHIPFDPAYLLATVGTVAMVFGYSTAILCSKSKAAIIAAVLLTLYGFLYVLLKAETYSLLIGTMGLFVILALIMFLTRNMDWYHSSADNRP